jgi:hypothetical protein
MLLDPREYWNGLDHQSRVLLVSVAASILLHAVLLTIHFRYPDAMRWNSSSQPLEVVLVNSKTRDKPERAKALAQSNLDGGGNSDAKQRATSPLPTTNPKEPGRDLAEMRRRQRELEAQQQQLLAQAREARSSVAAGSEGRNPSEEATPQVSGRDMASFAGDAQPAGADRAPDAGLPGAAAQALHRRQRARVPLRAVRGGLARQDRARRHHQLPGRGARQALRRAAADGDDPARRQRGFDRAEPLLRPEGPRRRGAPHRAAGGAVRRLSEAIRGHGSAVTRTWFFAQGDKVWTE